MNFKYKSRRSERRQLEKEFKKSLKKRKILKANEAFNLIKFKLLNFGWIIEEDHNNAIELNGKWSITSSPALKLVNDIYNITLLPHNNGIEISRLEVWEEFQCNGYAGRFLKSILKFLLHFGIADIYLIPLPAGNPDNRSLFSLETEQLEQFYYKRGFRKQAKNKYWKLDKDLFLDNIGTEDGYNFNLLGKNYIPEKSPKTKGKIIDIESRILSLLFQSKFNNRA